ncbi:MAG: gamma-glutamyltransferase family protein [Zestosphaera sp.]
MFRTPFYSLKGVVASESPLASAIGVRVLESGGNAVDASVATSLALSVTLPHLGGLGGDFFALVKDLNGNVVFVNGSGYAPSRMSIEHLKTLGLSEVPVEGPLSAVVPGMIDGLRVMWSKFGTLEWSKLVDLVIRSVKEGFPITPSLATALNNLKGSLLRDEGSRRTYFAATQFYMSGDLVRFDGMVRTLEAIRENPRNFYDGDVALKISEYVRSLGGLISYEDMHSFKAELGEPIRLQFDGMTIYEMPPNTQGVTTLHLLKLLRNADTGSSTSIRRLTAYLRAFETAYRIRDTYVGDPRYMSVSVDHLLSDEFLNNAVGGKSLKPRGEGDTTYFTVVDKEGLVVSGIQSLFYPFGSKVTEPTYGITLNCRASSFNLMPGHPNSLAPLKKPLHTLSAMIIVTEKKEMTLGLSGGHFRPQLHAEIFENIFKHKMSPQEAIEHPRFIWHPGTQIIELEEGFEEGEVGGYSLRKTKYPSRLGVAAAAEVFGSRVKAGYVDIRGDGLALGPV